MNGTPTRRRSPPWIIWSGLLLLAAALVAGTILVGLAWEQAKQIRSLGAELEQVRRDHRRLQGTAVALEERLAVVEANSPAEQLASLQTAMEASGDQQAHEELRFALAQVQEHMDSLQDRLDTLTHQADPGGSTVISEPDTRPPEVRLNVIRQKQSHSLSCESSAASMAAQYHNVALTEADVLAALPYNDNPYLGFRGNVDGPTGGIGDYGVYAGPVQKILNNAGLQARAIEGVLERIRAALARGNPVIAWVTYDCQVGTPTTQVIGDQTVTLVPYQHVVVLTGYDQDGMWANDPWDGQEDFYSNGDLRRAMSYFGNMALEVAAP
jgi:uncharacterized protein YvpB